jgi:3-dehydroquinate dehydratase type I
VDIEAATRRIFVDELLAAIRAASNPPTLIISYHDVSGTPSQRRLIKKLDELMGFGAPVVKIVTLARRSEDNLRVLELILQARRAKQAIIAFCMGDTGRISRVAAPVLGSFLTYGSLDGHSPSALGQFTSGELKSILKIVQHRDRV